MNQDTKDEDTGQLISIAAGVGFIGDLSLQILTNYMGGKSGWGLKKYFLLHGVGESLFIASGMMAIFYMIYIYVLKIPLTVLNLAIYGVILDVIFRFFKVFISLDGYYGYLNIIESAFWGALPMVIPYIIFSLIKDKKISWYKN